jgi:DNA-binding transcriptional LysR family regulator
MQLSDRIGRRIKLRDLHVLMAVVQYGSMNKAAAALHTTQPAVSRSIGELERTVGVSLLDRHPRGVQPTACGRALLDGGAAMFDELRQAVSNIEFLTDPAAGEVRIGCNPVLTAHFISTIIEGISRRYPRIVFHVVTARAGTLTKELHERSVDFLVARQFGSLAGEQLDFEALYDDFHVVVVAAHSPWARRRRIALAELLDEPWVLPALDSGIGAIVSETFRASGLDYPRRTVVTDDAQMRKSLVSSGRFLTIFPNSLLKLGGGSEIRALPIELPKTDVAVGIIMLRNRTLSPVARLFIKHARQVARPFAKARP